ncbi:hypothetical protein BDN70DRAFT_870929 [Pholiota conissans]|uniref:Uncharacterized protein n=1 Tax=Pholiota conissans TaxID=109636 RepID=A0A9P6CYT8_9AGAR|nr:hypothetical protein BDN70DRAFT_870929 [Pholiota conissans]
MNLLKYLFPTLLLAVCSMAWTYPQCEFDSECPGKDQTCCYHRGTRGLPPALCMSRHRCSLM